MASITLNYTKARLRADGTRQVCLCVCHNRVRAYIGLDCHVTENDWKKIEKSRAYPYLRKMLSDAEIVALELQAQGGGRNMTAKSLAEAIRDRLGIGASKRTDTRQLFLRNIRDYIDTRKTEGTKGVYRHTISRILGFDSNAETLTFDDITVDWLTRFDNYLALTAPSQNARNIHLRNIRAVFNYSIDNEYTTAYPFRRYRIRPVPTRKRNLKVEDLRRLFNAPVEPYAVRHLDMFKLIFFLIGINVVDLHRLTKIENGRIEYVRAKTHRPYSIKVEPEALEIIEKYRGEGQLLDIADTYKNHANYTKHINKALRSIGDMRRVGRGGKKVIEPWFPGLTTYWARHSWATIAASLDIPKETIAAALGHSTDSVTDIYIEFDRRKVDEANRRVIDWVLYNKK